jgi:hypothetical protein
MIEPHYFGNKLIKSFDFTFGFCMPNSVNTKETIYTMPTLTPKEVILLPHHVNKVLGKGNDSESL